MPAILPPRRANDGFDPKPAEVRGRVPVNFSEVWVRAKNDYCQEQILFLLAFTMWGSRTTEVLFLISFPS